MPAACACASPSESDSERRRAVIEGAGAPVVEVPPMAVGDAKVVIRGLDAMADEVITVERTGHVQ